MFHLGRGRRNLIRDNGRGALDGRTLMARIRGAALQELHQADHYQEKGPGAVPSITTCAFEKREKADGDQYGWSHQPSSSAALAIVGRCRAYVAEPSRAQPETEQDQPNRPDAVDIE